MTILLLFAFLAGVATVLSPCILPVLPALLSASAGQGRYRPLGVVTGLIVSFTFFTLTLTFLVQATGISPDFLRFLAILIIALFGVIMIFPQLSNAFARLTGSIADVGTKFQKQSLKAGTGFWGGMLLGAALGLVWTPCAGPILAAVTALVALKAISSKVILILLCYSIGAALPMFLIIYGGHWILKTSKVLSRHSEGIRQAFGVLMLASAFAIATHLDVAIQESLLNYIPNVEVENTPIVRNAIAKVATKNATPLPPYKEGALQPATKMPNMLPKIAGAPDFEGIAAWLNSPPLTMNSLRGKVVLIDFWTYSCINCIRTLPYITRWYDTYHDKGFVVIGVHTPEFEFEKSAPNVAEAIKRFHIHYPVALDNDYKTWQAYSNMYWPAHYLVDKDGIIRQVHFGEGGYMETENAIRELLNLPPLEEKEVIASHRPVTPETYLGYKRASMYTSSINIKPDQVAAYTYTPPLSADTVGLRGQWRVTDESITAESDDCFLDLNFLATRVYLVLGGHSSAPIQVFLDDKSLPKEYYTKDMNARGEIVVDMPRKYDIVNLHDQYGRHVVSLKIPKGISAFAFTYGDEP